MKNVRTQTKFYELLEGFGYPLCDSHARTEGLSLGSLTVLDCYLCQKED